MRPEEVLSHVRRQPFQPFRVFISDGSAYDVRHPEMIMVTRTNILFGITRANDRIPVESAWCDPVHVTRIERINGQDDTEKQST